MWARSPRVVAVVRLLWTMAHGARRAVAGREVRERCAEVMECARWAENFFLLPRQVRQAGVRKTQIPEKKMQQN